MLTENAIKLIETAIGITGLQEMITSTEQLEVTPKKTVHFDEVSYQQLRDNLTKSLPPEYYKEAKEAGEEIAVKEIKRAMNYEFEGKTVKALNDFYQKQIELKTKTDISEIEKHYKIELDEHKKLIETERKEKENIILKNKKDKQNYDIDLQFSLINIDAPPSLKDENEILKFKKNEIEKNKTYFKSLYPSDTDENGNTILKDSLTGQILKDETLNPVKLENKVKEFAAQNFISYSQQGTKGRGGKDEYPGNNLLSGIKSLDSLFEYAEKQGVKKGTKEFDALYAEFNKNNKT